MSDKFKQAPISGANSAPGANKSASTLVRHRDGVLEIPGELKLHFGGSLSRVHVAWRLSGPETGPVVVALGGISADRRVVSVSSQEPGWWRNVADVGKALPAERCRILSFDYLGGSGETTGPGDDAAFPAIASYDQANVLLRLLNHLGIKTLHVFLGASYGGMVGLAFAEKYPERVARLCVISAADRSHPMATAWRSVQRGIVRFAQQHGDAAGGLKLARALGMATYRSPEEFAARFAASPQREGDRHVFAVEKYLFSRGEDFIKRHRPQAYLVLSESIDLHQVDATRIFVPTTAIAIGEDQLVPLADMRAMVARLPNAQLIELSSVYGHDAFLKENDQLQPIFARLLEPSR
jgi:homoserine O-acetyltransferase/O-succinyltransferase